MAHFKKTTTIISIIMGNSLPTNPGIKFRQRCSTMEIEPKPGNSFHLRSCQSINKAGIKSQNLMRLIWWNAVETALFTIFVPQVSMNFYSWEVGLGHFLNKTIFFTLNECTRFTPEIVLNKKCRRSSMSFKV